MECGGCQEDAGVKESCEQSIGGVGLILAPLIRNIPERTNTVGACTVCNKLQTTARSLVQYAIAGCSARRQPRGDAYLDSGADGGLGQLRYDQGCEGQGLGAVRKREDVRDRGSAL